MCLICVDLIKQKMTWKEAQRNAQEQGHAIKDYPARQHAQDLHDALLDHDLDKLDRILDEGTKFQLVSSVFPGNGGIGADVEYISESRKW